MGGKDFKGRGDGARFRRVERATSIRSKRVDKVWIGEAYWLSDKLRIIAVFDTFLKGIPGRILPISPPFLRRAKYKVAPPFQLFG